MANNGLERRSSSRHRNSISSNYSNVTNGTAVDENDHEMYSGAASEVIPSSISSFHHTYHRTKSPRLSQSSYNIDDELRGRDPSLYDLDELNPLRPQISNTSSVDLHERSKFKFFTSNEIENAQGTSTLESDNPNEPIDYDTNWNTLEYEESSQLQHVSKPPSVTSRNRSMSITSSLFDKRQHRYSYGSHENSPIRRHNRTYSSSELSQSSPLLDGDDIDDSDPKYDHKNKKFAKVDPSNHDYYFKDFPAELHSQRFYIAEEDLVIGIAGYKNSLYRKIIYYFLCTVSFGLLYLFFRWYPRYRIKCMGTPEALGKSDWVVIETEFGALSVIDISRKWYNKRLSSYLSLPLSVDLPEDEDIKNSTSELHPDPLVPILISFQYRYIELYYSPVEDLFKTNLNWCDDSWSDVAHAKSGLSQEMHHTRMKIFGQNLIDIKEKSIGQLLVDEVLHPFYIFQVFSVILWLCDDYYYYAGCIFLISVVSVVQTLVETKQTMHRLRNVSRFKCDIRVFRNDFWTEITSNDLVPGDIYEVSDPSLSVFPCDSLLLNGDCIVNESMLTGESVPVSKLALAQSTADNILSEFRSTKFSNQMAKSFLYNGTKIIRARSSNDEPAMALVVRTGFNTTKGALVRSMLFPKPTGFKFYEDSFKYIGFMTLIALAGFVFSAINFIKLGLDYKIIILRALDIITIVVPPALPATLTIGTSFALSRLRHKQIFCISPSRVNVGGKLDIMCFDKTGTLTEDGLDIMGIHLSAPVKDKKYENSFQDMNTDVNKLFSGSQLNIEHSSEIQRKSKEFLSALVTCHSLKLIDEELVGDPLDQKMFEFTNWKLIEDSEDQTLVDLRKNFKLPDNITPMVLKPSQSSKIEYDVETNYLVSLKEFEFISQLRRMSVLVKPNEDDEDVYVYTKGAPEVMQEICTPESFPLNYNELLHSYTHNGYRVIACAGKKLPSSQFNPKSKRNLKFINDLTREQCENKLEFLGFIIFENKLKAHTSKVLKELSQADLRTVMCTGDNVLTAISVARESGLIRLDNQVFVPNFVDQFIDNDEQIMLPPKLIWEEVDNPNLLLDPVTLDCPNLSNYCLAVTGDIFKYILTEEDQHSLIPKMLMKLNIFARMSPDEKHELVEQLQKLDYTVGFCGDGANDCGALKAADVGISLSELEASVAAPFTSRIFEITCVLDVIKEGRASLVTSFSCFQYMSLYSLIQFITISILYMRGCNLGDFQFLYIDLFLIIPIAIFMSWSKPFDKLCIKRPTANLVSPKILIPLICNILLLLFFQIFIWIVCQKQPWYIKPVPGGDDAVDSTDNTVLFQFSNFQYILSAIVLAVGPPYREPVSENRPFIINVFVAIFISVLIMCIPVDSYLGNLLQLTYVTTWFKFYIFLWFLVNLIALYIGHKFLFPMLAKLYRQLVFGPKKSKKLFKNLKKDYRIVV